MEFLRDLSLVAGGFLAAELAAYLKWRRDRKDRAEERSVDVERREAERAHEAQRDDLNASVEFLAATHMVALSPSDSAARTRALEALSRLRILASPEVAMAASRHYVSTSHRDNGEMYQATLANLVNRLRERFGNEALREFEEFLDGPVGYQ